MHPPSSKPIIYLVCGVPGSGKTWVCNQLQNDFIYVAHDDFIKLDYVAALSNATDGAHKPLLAECPFGERELREKLQAVGFKVIPVFVVETPETVRVRYQARTGKPATQAMITRAISIGQRAREWGAYAGKSEQVLNHLRMLAASRAAHNAIERSKTAGNN